MLVSLSTPSPFEQYHLLVVIGDVAQVFASMGVVGNRTAGHIDHTTFTLLAGALCLGSVLTMFGEEVPLVAQV